VAHPSFFEGWDFTRDNGNVYQIVNNTDNTRTQNFIYDSLNRIQQAYSTGTYWGETFGPTATNPGVAPSTSGIDAWGNLINRSGVVGKTYYESLSTSAGTNNRLSGFGYDAAGNMTSNSPSTYKYDAENRLTTTSGYTYYYDGDGNRVAKSNGSTGTVYWRGPTGDPILESSLTGTNQEEYIFFNGSRVARRDVATNFVHYYFSDHLGSHGVVVSPTGSGLEQDIDYYPFGGVMSDFSPNVAQHYRFNGKERDTESGLDNFGARYDASSLGRFMTPDWAAKPVTVPYAKFGDPQSLNLYSYVENGPVNRIDADGHVEWAPYINFNSGYAINIGAATAEAAGGGGGMAGVPYSETIETDSMQEAQNQTVTVTVQQVKAANPYGHSVIKVGDGDKVGLVPNSDKDAAKAVAKEAASAAASKGAATPSSVPGHIEKLAPNRVIEGTATIQVTPDQARAMQKTINEAKAQQQEYDPGFHNCANFVEQVLRSGGINAPNDMTPGGLVEDLNQQSKH
jgi:RHS repeat-associated protein